jgi:tricorn protease-like protein
MKNKGLYSFDIKTRRKFYLAYKKFDKDGDYVTINKMIMEIQRPYVEKLEKINKALNQ